MLEVVGKREIERVLEVTDRLGIHRESVAIPLMPRHPGRVRQLRGGKIEITVEAEADLDRWLPELEIELKRLLESAGSA